MKGFWVLARKEVTEQRRTWKFLGLTGFFTLLALLISVIPYIVLEIRGDQREVEEAQNLLEAFRLTATFLGTFVTIMVGMGLLANERTSGTAAMTLSKPVTRSGFILAKFLGLAFSLFASLAIASVVMYVLTLLLFADGGVLEFATFMASIGVTLLLIGALAFFWSGVFRRQLVAGGVTLAMFIAMAPLDIIEGTRRFQPTNSVEWGASFITGETSDQWPAFLIALGCIALLTTGAWAVFRRKEL